MPKNIKKKGIATQLILDAFLKLEVTPEIYCCLAWKKENRVNLKSSLLRNEFYYQTTITNYWERDSLDKKYNCAHCGSPPCKCAAEVWTKKALTFQLVLFNKLISY